MLVDGNNYTVFDMENNIIKEVKDDFKVNALDVANPAANLDNLHIRNFFEGILNKSDLNAGIESGHKSTLLVQLGNIAQRVGRSLNIDHENGHIVNDKEALSYWARTYEKGWEMKL